jgi:hypothetical protein
MAQFFQNITSIALEEMFDKYLQTSKFGYFISEEQKDILVKEIAEFIETSRYLKARGDHFLAQGGKSIPPSSGAGFPRQGAKRKL